MASLKEVSHWSGLYHLFAFKKKNTCRDHSVHQLFLQRDAVGHSKCETAWCDRCYLLDSFISRHKSNHILMQFRYSPGRKWIFISWHLKSSIEFFMFKAETSCCPNNDMSICLNSVTHQVECVDTCGPDVYFRIIWSFLLLWFLILLWSYLELNSTWKMNKAIWAVKQQVIVHFRCSWNAGYFLFVWIIKMCMCVCAGTHAHKSLFIVWLLCMLR